MTRTISTSLRHSTSSRSSCSTCRRRLRLAVAARRTLPLPYARLRPTGHLLELGPRELALNEADAQALATAIGVQISPEQVAGLLTRTEGWPAATYLGLRFSGSARAQDQTGGWIAGH